MSFSLLQYLFLGAATMFFVGAITPGVRKFAIRINAIDAPIAAHKTHKIAVPYLGGLAILIGVLLASYGSLLFNGAETENYLLASYVLIPAVFISAMGLVDDLRGLEPWPRLIVQTATASIVAGTLILTDTMGVAFNNTFLNVAVSILWIVGVCNSINFFDNLDGGAAGTVVVVCIFIFIIALDRGQILVSALAIVTAGATSGFLFWNKSPAKIYMGDAGALFLGIIVSVLTIRLNPGITPNFLSLAIPLSLLAIPILDTSVAVVSRIRRGLSPFTGGRDHLSHRLIRRGMNRKSAAFALWGLSGAFGFSSLLIYNFSEMLGRPLVAFNLIAWILLFILFIRIPSTD
jgi:UDP-GlcNAc:undecaprenyl-phosphate/decaprenyl-phosphate GlcNAc-1-phosphate transferase